MKVFYSRRREAIFILKLFIVSKKISNPDAFYLYIYICKIISYNVQLFIFHNLPFVTDIPIRLQSKSKVFSRVEGKRRKMLEYWKNISLSLVCCKINSRVALNRL